MDALEALRNKRDTRSYADTPVEHDVIQKILAAARMAGSAKNNQPVRLVVVTDPSDRTKLTESGDFTAWIDNAPINIVVAVDSGAGVRTQFDVGRHSQNLMVAAHAEGLASCPVTVHYPQMVRDLLGIPDHYDPCMIITIGHPSNKPRKSLPDNQRVDLTDYARFDRWS